LCLWFKRGLTPLVSRTNKEELYWSLLSSNESCTWVRMWKGATTSALLLDHQLAWTYCAGWWQWSKNPIISICDIIRLLQNNIECRFTMYYQSYFCDDTSLVTKIVPVEKSCDEWTIAVCGYLPVHNICWHDWCYCSYCNFRLFRSNMQYGPMKSEAISSRELGIQQYRYLHRKFPAYWCLMPPPLAWWLWWCWSMKHMRHATVLCIIT
jgi:hypothetical protein